MHLLFAQFTVRWLALMSGAAHATTALRALSRHAPEAEPDEDPAPRAADTGARRRPPLTVAKPARRSPKPA